MKGHDIWEKGRPAAVGRGTAAAEAAGRDGISDLISVNGVPDRWSESRVRDRVGQGQCQRPGAC